MFIAIDSPGHPDIRTSSLWVTEPCRDGAGSSVTCWVGLAPWAGSSTRGDPGSIPGWGRAPGEGNGGSGQTPFYTTAFPPASRETLCFLTSWRPTRAQWGPPVLPRCSTVQSWEAGWAGSSAPKMNWCRGLGTELSAHREPGQPSPV